MAHIDGVNYGAVTATGGYTSTVGYMCPTCGLWVNGYTYQHDCKTHSNSHVYTGTATHTGTVTVPGYCQKCDCYIYQDTHTCPEPHRTKSERLKEIEERQEKQQEQLDQILEIATALKEKYLDAD